MPFKSSGSVAFSEISSHWGDSGSVRLSDYYRGGSLVPNVSQNSAIPTSGAISLSNFYGGVQTRLANSLNISPFNTGSIFGYWTSSGVIGGGARGSLFVAIPSNPYTDGNGNSVLLNSAVHGWISGQFTLQLSNLTDNDLKFWRVYVDGNGVNTVLSRSSAVSTGSGAGGRIWNWNLANPFQVGFDTNIAIEFLN